MMRTIVAAAVAVACAGSAAAGEVAINLEGGWAELSNAKRSAEAVFDGASGGFTFGAGVRWSVTPSIYGERAFVSAPDQPPFGLGHPLSLRLIPVHAQAGWRFRPGTSFVPYVGLGVGLTSYREESTIGDIAEPTISETKFSGLVSAGLEYGSGPVRFGVDLSYSTVPDSLGVGGVSQVYGEDDLGGFTALGRIVFVP